MDLFKVLFLFLLALYGVSLYERRSSWALYAHFSTCSLISFSSASCEDVDNSFNDQSLQQKVDSFQKKLDGIAATILRQNNTYLYFKS